jgi:peptide-methionine (R)-S-oxide reductase
LQKSRRKPVSCGLPGEISEVDRTVRPLNAGPVGWRSSVGLMGYQVSKSDDEWREQLSPQEYAVLRQAGTEPAFTGEYTDTKTTGVYRCRACQAELFRSDTKFESHCGWPSFYAPLAEDRVEYIEDRSFGMKRVEVRCANCGSHLGHVFEGEGYGTPTDQRYCINSISLTLEPAE